MLVQNRFSYPNSASSRRIKKWALRLIKQAKNPVLTRLSGERPPAVGRKKEKKNPPKNGSSPLAFDGALRESPPIVRGFPSII